jgi:lipopolysaccharide export system permease protein
MKKINQLVIRAFIGPFLVVFSVLVIIFLVRFVLMYIEELSGKGLPVSTYLELFFYFSFNSIPLILPLSILFSTLMTYGNLGQHNELTAIKSAGISLVRILIPIFIFSIFVSGVSFYLNNTFIPKVNLRAYQLLWDIKHKKAAFNLKEGIFYNEIPNYSIKVDKINPDGKQLKDIIIYDHQDRTKGNVTHIVADSGYMELINNESYLKLTLYDGVRNAEHTENAEDGNKKYTRSKFTKSVMTFDLTSFQLDETPKELFSGNRQMMGVDTLEHYIKDFKKNQLVERNRFVPEAIGWFKYGIGYDSSFKAKEKPVIYTKYDQKAAYTNAYNRSKNILYSTEQKNSIIDGFTFNINTYKVEQLHKYVQAVACIIMFLIGAPIGSVLKKGGMGIPGIVTLVFFIIYYVIYIMFEKYARADDIDVYVGSWGAIIVLLPFGLFFVYQASIDSRLFEIDLDGFLDKIWKKNKTNNLN